MDIPRPWQDPIEVVPLDAAALTTSIEPFEQKATASIQILPQASAIAADSKVLDVATEVLLHILALEPNPRTAVCESWLVLPPGQMPPIDP
jgi:hypothetical protein